MDLEQLRTAVGKTWDDSIMERLVAYVRIPNKSPMFDPQWERNGYMEAAVQLMADWCRAQPIPGMRVGDPQTSRENTALARRCSGRAAGVRPALRTYG